MQVQHGTANLPPCLLPMLTHSAHTHPHCRREKVTPEGVPREITPQDEAALRECLQYFPGAHAAAAAAAAGAGAAVPHGAAFDVPGGWQSHRQVRGWCRVAPAN